MAENNQQHSGELPKVGDTITAVITLDDKVIVFSTNWHIVLVKSEPPAKAST